MLRLFISLGPVRVPRGVRSLTTVEDELRALLRAAEVRRMAAEANILASRASIIASRASIMASEAKIMALDKACFLKNCGPCLAHPYLTL